MSELLLLIAVLILAEQFLINRALANYYKKQADFYKKELQKSENRLFKILKESQP